MCQHENEEKSTKKKKKENSIKDRRWRDFVLFSIFFHKKDFLSNFKKFDDYLKTRKNDKEKKFIKNA